MTARMLRSALLAAALALMATATAGAAPPGSTRINDVIDLTGTTSLRPAARAAISRTPPARST